MFTRARIKLTAWYLLFITMITFSFSLVVYRIISLEIDRVERTQRQQFQRRLFDQFGLVPLPVYYDSELLAEAKRRLFLMLGLIDLSILTVTAIVGYFLAGRTLKPIADMLEEQNRFISDSSHELRTPLTSLKSEIEVNLRDKKLTITAARRLLTSNLEEVNRLQILSDNLIKLAQYQKKGDGFPHESILVSELVNEAVKQVTGLAKAKKIILKTSISDSRIWGSKSSLVETLVILLDNAIKYSPAKSRVEISSCKTKNHTQIKISDQGIGIDPVDIPHIFDRFYRGSKSRAVSESSGYGLGLSIAKEIISRHHGSIKVSSLPKRGTTFTIRV